MTERLKLIKYTASPRQENLLGMLNFACDVSMSAQTQFCCYRFYMDKPDFQLHRYEVLAWIKKSGNVRGMFIFQTSFHDSRQMEIGFEDDRSAFAFKMRWC